MTSRTILLDPGAFFHARPAARIANAAKAFDSVVMAMLGTEFADVKNPLSLMRLSHPQGSAIELMADGPDEERALNAVLDAVQEEFPFMEI